MYNTPFLLGCGLGPETVESWVAVAGSLLSLMRRLLQPARRVISTSSCQGKRAQPLVIFEICGSLCFRQFRHYVAPTFHSLSLTLPFALSPLSINNSLAALILRFASNLIINAHLTLETATRMRSFSSKRLHFQAALPLHSTLCYTLHSTLQTLH